MYDEQGRPVSLLNPLLFQSVYFHPAVSTAGQHHFLFGLKCLLDNCNVMETRDPTSKNPCGEEAQLYKTIQSAKKYQQKVTHTPC